MNEELEFTEAPAAPGGVDWSLIYNNASLAYSLLLKVQEFRNLAVGDSLEPGDLSLKVGGKLYNWDLGEVTRQK